MLDLIKRTTKRQKYGQEDEAISYTIDDNSKPHFEEVLEDVAVAWGENHDGQEGRKGTMEHTWTHLTDGSSSFEDSLFPCWGRSTIDVWGWRVNCEESVANVRTIVNRKANCNRDVDDGYAVESDSPKVEQSEQE